MRNRCIIPISTYYEWSGGKGAKQTFAFQSSQPDEWLWAAGLWEIGSSGPAYSMITRSASTHTAFLHERMPALLAPEVFEEFLNSSDPRDLFVPEPDELTIFRCENPLLQPSSHRGPEKIETLPGF